MVWQKYSKDEVVEDSVSVLNEFQSMPRRTKSHDGKMVCPKCSSFMTMGYDEPECISCGYADYAFTGIRKRLNKRLISSATKHIFRYIGPYPNLFEKLAYVKVVRVGHRAVFAVTCPFCGDGMEQFVLSGKRGDKNEKRYFCGVGHRVSITPRPEGSFGWK